MEVPTGMRPGGQLKIAQKWEDMAGYAYVALRHIPKSERFTLGAELRESIWRGVRIITQANAARSKANLLRDLDVEIKTMLSLLRVSHGLRILPTKQYELWSSMLVEIGRMLGGWLKYCEGSRG